MTVWPARAAAAIVLGIAFSPIIGAAPSVAAAGQRAPVAVTMVAALTAPERGTGFIDAELLENYTSPFGVLTRELDEVYNRPVALGIDPSIIASIRVLGTDAPPSATAWLERLATAENETFPLSWADADLTLGIQAGSATLLEPESLDFAIDPARFSPATEETPTATPEPTTTPQPDDGSPPPLPTSESLVAWEYTIPSLAWPTLNSVSKNDFSVLAEAYEATILQTSNVSGGGHSARTEIDGAAVLLSDERLSLAFGAAVGAGSGSAWNTAVGALATSLAAVPSTTDAPATIVLALDRDVELADADLGPTIDRVAASANVRTMSLADQLASTASSVAVVDRSHDEAIVASVKKMLQSELADRDFATIAAEPSLITSERRLDLLATLGNTWRDNPVGWTAAQTEYRNASLELRDSVKVVKSSSITLWADRASLPVTVSNDLDQAVTVYVTVRPQTPLLKVENAFVAVTVEPSSQRKAQVPVQSLSNGTVALDVSLHGPTGIAIGVPHLVHTTVQAGWETPFTVGLGILVVAIFAAGITRTILRRRRARASEA